ncbi:ABC transporter ATP-binding protein [Pelomonas puraquae]|uniref:ABC transporter ATP-binding protein n=1 Tax=Roseateles puraquae TaxID=431059 RepID=A0A254NP76_9BURK|nr:ABC transporter ATP-binding protein [Roseateles puraquae]MDG0854702.1 ABC transporter ATP-binding protein [Roseateles puraquae]OWR06173.1 ABC transporter ATP-binding protein [Roseateles puraquae]
MSDTVVRLQGVRKAFNLGQPSEVEVLHGIDLHLRAGEFCAVIGPSGSGKSTLLNIIGLLDRPTAGQLAVCGQETTALDDAALTRLRGRSIGFVFQYHHLIGAFTAVENVMMPMLGDAGFPTSAMRERALALLKSVGLSHRADNLATHLSGGEQQRVAVARSLAMQPAVLLADEPTGNLDTQSAEVVFGLLREVNREHGTAVLFVTHNPALAARCDRTLEVVDGRISRAD